MELSTDSLLNYHNNLAKDSDRLDTQIIMLCLFIVSVLAIICISSTALDKSTEVNTNNIITYQVSDSVGNELLLDNKEVPYINDEFYNKSSMTIRVENNLPKEILESEELYVTPHLDEDKGFQYILLGYKYNGIKYSIEPYTLSEY